MMKRLKEKLSKSCINYFSDLFIAAMVVTWIITIVFMIAFAIYSTLVWADNSSWSDLGNLVAVPLTAGGAIWMVKNSVQHAIANKQGRECPHDFAAANDDMYDTSTEEAMEFEED